MELNQKWYIVTCFHCSASFAIPDDVDDRLRESHENFYCPFCRGGQSYSAKSEKEKLKDELNYCRRVIREKDVAVSNAEYEKESVVRSNRALKGVVTKKKQQLEKLG